MSFEVRLPTCGLLVESERRSSARKGLVLRFARSSEAVPPDPIGGRGPPGRHRRPELQALSNSLQLTSI